MAPIMFPGGRRRYFRGLDAVAIVLSLRPCLTEKSLSPSPWASWPWCFVVGLYSLFRGGDFARSYSNKIMRLRIVAQFVAIVIIMAVLYFYEPRRGRRRNGEVSWSF